MKSNRSLLTIVFSSILIVIALAFQNCGADDFNMNNYNSVKSDTLSVRLIIKSNTQTVTAVQEGSNIELTAEHETLNESANYIWYKSISGSATILGTSTIPTLNLNSIPLSDNNAAFSVFVTTASDRKGSSSMNLSVTVLPALNFVRTGAVNTNFINNYRFTVNYETGSNEFLHGEISDYASNQDDRTYSYAKGQLNDAVAGSAIKANSIWLPSATTYVNTLKQTNVSFTCPDNKAITGHNSIYGNSDRRYRYQCSDLLNPRNNAPLVRKNCETNIDYVNNPSFGVNYTCPGNKIIVGIQSIYSNADRRFKFTCCDYNAN